MIVARFRIYPKNLNESGYAYRYVFRAVTVVVANDNCAISSLKRQTVQGVETIELQVICPLDSRQVMCDMSSSLNSIRWTILRLGDDVEVDSGHSYTLKEPCATI